MCLLFILGHRVYSEGDLLSATEESKENPDSIYTPLLHRSENIYMTPCYGKQQQQNGAGKQEEEQQYAQPVSH